MWVKYNPNPVKNITSDCAVRAVSAALDITWEEAFTLMAANAYLMGQMLDSDLVWSSILRQYGFTKHFAPDISIREFAEENPKGIYVVKTDNHVVTVVDSNYYDTWDSGDEPVIYYWYKEK